MQRLLTVISLVFLCFFTVGCRQGEEVAGGNGGVENRTNKDKLADYSAAANAGNAGETANDAEADIQAVKEVLADFNAAINNGDIDKASFYHAEEAIVVPPNEPALIGKEASINLLQQLFDHINYQEVDEVNDVQVSGDLAVAHYTWTSANTFKAGGSQPNSSGNGLMVLKKQPDETWKFIYLIWSDESLTSPEQAE